MLLVNDYDNFVNPDGGHRLCSRGFNRDQVKYTMLGFPTEVVTFSRALNFTGVAVTESATAAVAVAVITRMCTCGCTANTFLS